MLTKEQIADFKERLVKEKEKTLGYIENREENYDTGELSHYDNHPADAGDELFMRERDQAITELEEDMIEEIDEALAAIEAGTYGICKVCGKEIEFDRLDIIPETLLCFEHAKEETNREGNEPGSRPSEEDVLNPDITATSKQIDGGADGFSQVEEFGSSDTIADREDGVDPTRTEGK